MYNNAVKKLFLVGAGIFFVLLAVQTYSWYKVSTSLRLPHLPNNETPATYGLAYQTRTFKTENGTSLEGWYVPVKDAKAVIIVIHGYRDVKGMVVEHGSYLHKAGYTTFFIDLSSDLPGSKATLGVQEHKDIISAYRYMRSLPENKNKKIGFFGGSMGASSSLIAAGKSGEGDFIIASVPYANYKSLFEQRLKLENLPVALLPFVLVANGFELGFDYESYAPDKYIQSIRKPLFIIASAKDSKVNGNDAELLYRSANAPKYFWKADAVHDVYKDRPDEYKKRVLEFLANVD